jgi:anaerobic C4-dicarboxylate transporter
LDTDASVIWSARSEPGANSAVHRDARRIAMLRHPYTISAAAFVASLLVGSLALTLAVALPVAVPSGLLPEPVQQAADNPSRQVRVVLQSPWEAQ